MPFIDETWAEQQDGRDLPGTEFTDTYLGTITQAFWPSQSQLRWNKHVCLKCDSNWL